MHHRQVVACIGTLARPYLCPAAGTLHSSAAARVLRHRHGPLPLNLPSVPALPLPLLLPSAPAGTSGAAAQSLPRQPCTSRRCGAAIPRVGGACVHLCAPLPSPPDACRVLAMRGGCTHTASLESRPAGWLAGGKPDKGTPPGIAFHTVAHCCPSPLVTSHPAITELHGWRCLCLPASLPAEVLDVRWANDDPNPRAVARVQHEREVALRDAYVKVRCACCACFAVRAVHAMFMCLGGVWRSVEVRARGVGMGGM